MEAEKDLMDEGNSDNPTVSNDYDQEVPFSDRHNATIDSEAVIEPQGVSVPMTEPKDAGELTVDDNGELGSNVDMNPPDTSKHPAPDKTEMMDSERSAERISRQFWQAGDLFPDNETLAKANQVGLDHARLHPRFLHSNATSHKWALGAFVELLDNSMDEVATGCSYVKVDKLDHPSQGAQNPMLLVEDNGGGMEPSVIRHCMSFGFSRKKGKHMIGQYGNGFKTSTMRLGADALVLTKSKKSSTCSVGLLSFTFLSATKSQDVLVPIIDYSLDQRTRIVADEDDWQRKLSLICNWGPFESETDLWKQFDSMPSQGTRVLIWNLWQTSEGTPELDFNADDDDIRLQGGEEEVQDSTRKRKSDEGIKRCQAYRHSLREYVAILYLEWPEGFQINIRGKNVEPLPIQKGMKHTDVYEYRPRQLQKDETIPSDYSGSLVVHVHIGFAEEAPETNVAGFCVYHRNRLIKPYWKVYSSASSVGRGVIGYLQVDFVEPAHDKQDFENTPPLQKLEKYLKRQVPLFWRSKAQFVGYQEGGTQNNSGRGSVRNYKMAMLPQIQQSLQEDLPPDGRVNTEDLESHQINVMAQKGASAHQTIEDAGVSQEVSLRRTSDMTNKNVRKLLASSSTLPKRAKKPPVRAKHTNGLFQLPRLPDNWTWTEAENAGATCIQQMQGEVGKLQEGMQDLCNTHSIDENIQGHLGKIFGTAITNIMNPVKVLSNACGVQMAVLKALLAYLSELKGSRSMDEPIPKPIVDMMTVLGIPVTSPMLDDRTITSDETHDASDPSLHQAASPLSQGDEGSHHAAEDQNGGLNRILAAEVQRLIKPKKEVHASAEEDLASSRGAQMGASHPNFGSECTRGGPASCSIGSQVMPEKVVWPKYKETEELCPNPQDMHAKLCGNLRAQEPIKSLEKRQAERSQRKPANLSWSSSTQSAKSYPMEQLGRNVIMKFLHNGLKESEERVARAPNAQAQSGHPRAGPHRPGISLEAKCEKAHVYKENDASEIVDPVQMIFQTPFLPCSTGDDLTDGAAADVNSIVQKNREAGENAVNEEQEHAQPQRQQVESTSTSKRPASPDWQNKLPFPKRSKPNGGHLEDENKFMNLQNLGTIAQNQFQQDAAATGQGNGVDAGGDQMDIDDADVATLSTNITHQNQHVVDVGQPLPGG